MKKTIHERVDASSHKYYLVKRPKQEDPVIVSDIDINEGDKVIKEIRQSPVVIRK